MLCKAAGVVNAIMYTMQSTQCLLHRAHLDCAIYLFAVNENIQH